jgi:uncharacterized protein
MIEMAGHCAHLVGMKWFVLIGLLGICALAGCDRNSESRNSGSLPGTAPPGQTPKHVFPTHAQSKLATLRLWLGASEVSAEMALTGLEQETGMMFRTNLDENAGMIFPLPHPQHADFWMKNCPLPLTAAYIDPHGQILEIRELHANDTNGVVAESPNILYVLEMNQGWFARHDIKLGTVVRSEKGTLQETFIRRN